METQLKKKMVSFKMLNFHEFMTCYTQLNPSHTILLFNISIAKPIHNKRALIISHDHTIAWAAQNRVRIDSEKKKTADNKETKSHQVLQKQISAASSQSIALAKKAEKAPKVQKRAEKATLDNDLAVAAKDYEQKKRGRELAFDEEKKAEPNKTRKILLESRFNMDILQLAHNYYETTSILKGDISEEQ
jgi:hypothetical protein